MKTIKYSKAFHAYYLECKRKYPHFSNEFQDAVLMFLEERKSVRDHALTKRILRGKRSFSITSDIRVVYQETKTSFIFLRVGSHQKVCN